MEYDSIYEQIAKGAMTRKRFPVCTTNFLETAVYTLSVLGKLHS